MSTERVSDGSRSVPDGPGSVSEILERYNMSEKVSGLYMESFRRFQMVPETFEKLWNIIWDKSPSWLGPKGQPLVDQNGSNGIATQSRNERGGGRILLGGGIPSPLGQSNLGRDSSPPQFGLPLGPL
jgi:hypothetical protein